MTLVIEVLGTILTIWLMLFGGAMQLGLWLWKLATGARGRMSR